MKNLHEELLDLVDEGDAAESCARNCRLEGNYSFAEEWEIVASAIRSEEWRIRCLVASKEDVNE